MLNQRILTILAAMLLSAQSVIAGFQNPWSGNGWLEQLDAFGPLGSMLAGAYSGYSISQTATGAYPDDEDDGDDSETETLPFLEFGDTDPSYADDDEGEEDDLTESPDLRLSKEELDALAQLEKGYIFLALEKVKECYDSGKLSEKGHLTFIALILGTETDASPVKNKFWPIRKNAAKAIAAILATDIPTAEERAALLDMLIGINGAGGLAGDSDEFVRSAVIQAIRKILIKKTLTPSEEIELVSTLTKYGNDEKDLANDWHFEVRAAVAKAIGKLLSSGKLSNESYGTLLAALVGEPSPYFGMGCDRNVDVRIATARAIGRILTNTTPDPVSLERLTQALIGSEKFEGLCDDWDVIVAMEAVKAVGNILAKDTLPTEKREAFVEVLVSPGPKEGFLYSKHAFMRRNVLEAIRGILITGLPDETETTLLFNALTSFLEDKKSANRGPLAEAIGEILGTEMLTFDQRAVLINALIRLGTTDPVEKVRTLAMIEIEWLLRTAP